MLSCTLFFVYSCQKEDTANDEIPAGWKSEQQIISVDGKDYNVKVAGDPNGRKMKYINAPKEVLDFIKKYDSTIVPHIVHFEKETKVFYYKDYADFKAHVQFQEGNKNQLKGYNEGRTISWEHGENNGWSLQGNCTDIWSSYFNNTNWGWGSRNNYVGNNYNDRISSITIQKYSSNQPITYIGWEHAGAGNGTPVIITKISSFNYNTTNLWAVGMQGSFWWWTTWNDEISSFETYSTGVIINGTLYN